jgi:hypothetical protein
MGLSSSFDRHLLQAKGVALNDVVKYVESVTGRRQATISSVLKAVLTGKLEELGRITVSKARDAGNAVASST